MASFYDLPDWASHSDIYEHAGRIFAEQVKRDKRTDYTQSKAFNDAIWYIAEQAQRRGFTNLKNMSLTTIAKEMGGTISFYLRTNPKQHF